ncbi:MAG TPA: peptidoglycan DD-metalloendopeptidase family protein [Candidatus Onthousia faecipullorum]|uniref:Peptidoglycan DD-metalloendopeptidase family protein n=1 Tax=Candidatus Onthousia faecipullorum TaxID=2840887 RepID=A0A9D1GAU8_9FIRM|nr:peptidoglycan DD-metalloendopeptidase family protein [Candidatus Onthousia faecipullorum]
MKKVMPALLIFLLTIFLVPINTNAKTLKELEEEVTKFTNELQSKNNQIAANDAEVAEIEERIKSIQSQIKEITNETTILESEIAESNQEIARKSEESKSLFQYIQVSEGENAYLEYIFGATSVTDMVYRMAIVEQLTEYNDKVMKELTELVEENEARKEELAKKNKELEELTDELEQEQEKINADSAAIRETMPSVEEQLKSAKENLQYYKNLGCGLNEDIYACQYRVEQANNSGSSGGYVPSAAGFYKPMESGYVTQNWMNNGHLGIDLSNSNKTIEVHPIATGTVFKIYYDNCSWSNCSYGCNGRARVVKIRHNVNGRYIYSTYAHLSSFGDIEEGQVVTPDTVIGRMGNTGCSTGPHLHLEITTCDWHSGGGCTWATYKKSTINPRTYIGFPSGLRVWWYGR